MYFEWNEEKNILLKDARSISFYPSRKHIEASKLDKKKKLFKQVANNTLEKMTTKKSYNLRLFENDIESIKAIALQKGLPYQSLISSIIHQVATRQIKI